MIDQNGVTSSIPASALIYTNLGYKKAANIEVGDYVMTHNRNFEKVSSIEKKDIKPVYSIIGNFGELSCTYDHKVFARTLENGELSPPVWKMAKNLTDKDFLAIVLPTEEKMPNWDLEANMIKILSTNDFWYIIGSYIAHGSSFDGEIVLKGAADKIKAIKERAARLFSYNIENNLLHIQSEDLYIFLNRYGKFIEDISSDIINLPCDLLQAFLEGVFQRNDKQKRYYKFSSENKQLIYGLALCVLKIYKKAFQITYEKGKYVLLYKSIYSTNMFCDTRYCYSRIKYFKVNTPELVYNLSVEQTPSYTVQNMIVHQ